MTDDLQTLQFMLSKLPNANVMKKLHVLLSALLPFSGMAQCQIQAFSITADCANDAPEAQLYLDGGELPYQLTFTGSNGESVSLWDIFEDGLFTTEVGNFLIPILVPPVEVVVTDANGCTASASASFPMHAIALPEVWFERACDSINSVLLWSGTYGYWSESLGSSSGGLEDPCGGGPYTYEIIDSQTWATVNTGDLSTDWTQLQNGFWQLDAPVVPGSYYVDIRPASQWTGCQNGSVTYCYRNKGAITDGTSEGCGQRFQLKAFLGGPLATGATTMRDSLRVKGLVPSLEPYTALGYSYVGSTGGESIAPSLLNIAGGNAVVDWVVVELRSATAPGTVLHSMPALLQRDGDVVGTNGSTILRAPFGPKFHHVAIRHRNHLGVMSSDPLWLNSSPLVSGGYPLYDLRSALLPTFGNAARMPSGSNLVLWPGDANFNGQVKYTGNGNDRDVVLSAVGGSTPTNVVNNVYSGADANLDGVVKYVGLNNDRDIILQTVGGTVPTAVRTQQLP